MPTPSPMGIIAMSAPIVKKPMPTMSSAAPPRNKSSVPAGSGVRKTLAKRTIAVIGSTDENASIIFSYKILFMLVCSVAKTPPQDKALLAGLYHTFGQKHNRFFAHVPKPQ